MSRLARVIKCPVCKGKGTVEEEDCLDGPNRSFMETVKCRKCNGAGEIIAPKTLEEKLMDNLESVCGSIRHDFGLLSDNDKRKEVFKAKEYIHAICKEITHRGY